MAMRKSRRLLITIGILLVVLTVTGVTSVALAPTLSKQYIEDHYPGITVNHVEFHWREKRATLYGVQVDRENIKGRLDVIEVDSKKNVAIHGGKIEITLVEKKEDAEPSSVGSITADDLYVTVIRDDLKVVLSKTTVNATEVCFEDGHAEHPKGSAFFSTGCVKRDKSLVKLSQVSIPVTLPFDVPEIRRQQVLVITDLVVEPEKKHVTIEEMRVAPVLLTRPLAEHKTVPPIAKLGPTVLDLDDENLTVTTPTLEVTHSWVAPEPVTFEKVKVVLPVKLLKEEPATIKLTLGRATISIDPIAKSVWGDAACASWFDALPKPLPEGMAGMTEHFIGNLSFKVTTKPPSIDIVQNCRFACKSKPITDILQRKFSYEAYDRKGQLVTREAGPGVAGWTSIGDLPQFVPEAFILLEDPGFNKHRGVLPKALENSLKVNLEKGGFMKGGSTITMQLAKNLWLQRHKTLGRKAQEALLTFALESCLPKDRILETYLNVIEFGPNIYGIGPAAKHWFKKSASNLAPDEAFFLASILPAPRKALPPEGGGLEKARKIMKMLSKSGFLSDAYIDDGAPLDTRIWDASE